MGTGRWRGYKDDDKEDWYYAGSSSQSHVNTYFTAKQMPPYDHSLQKTHVTTNMGQIKKCLTNQIPTIC